MFTCLMNRTVSAKEQCFYLITNQRTILSAIVFHRSEQDHSHYWRPLISGKATNMAHIHPEEAQWPITSIPASDGVKLNTRHSSGARSRVLLRHRSPLLYINTRRRRFNSLSSRSVARLGPNPKQVRFCCHGSLLSC